MEIIFNTVTSHHSAGYVTEKDTDWFGPCNTDSDMADGGDQETRLNMLDVRLCSVSERNKDITVFEYDEIKDALTFFFEKKKRNLKAFD